MAPDLLVRKAFHVVEHHDDPLMIGQLTQRTLEIDHRCGTDAGRRGQLVEEIRLDVTPSRESRLRRANPDRREPRCELRVSGVPVKAATASEPCLLDDVVDFISPRGTEQPHDDHAKTGRVSRVERPERRFVAPDKPTDQSRVGQVGEEAARGHISKWEGSSGWLRR